MKKLELLSILLCCFNVVVSGAVLGMRTAIPDTSKPDPIDVEELKQHMKNVTIGVDNSWQPMTS